MILIDVGGLSELGAFGELSVLSWGSELGVFGWSGRRVFGLSGWRNLCVRGHFSRRDGDNPAFARSHGNAAAVVVAIAGARY